MAALRKKRNLKNLHLDSSPIVTGTNQTASTIPSEYDIASPLVIGLEYQLDLRQEDLLLVKELGHGSGGSVDKVMHAPTTTVMARKSIYVEQQVQVKNQILRELRILHDCNSPYIVSFYGAYMNERAICLCIEYMDLGSLEMVYKKYGPVDADILGKITVNMLHGLTYLYDTHRIIHRDIKPSNILVNSAGQIKLCDFGVSGILVNSIAKTFVGTNSYMSPERIQGGAYSVKSDVWSVGITLMELAMGKFPLMLDQKTVGILDLLQFIVNEPAPTLPEDEPYPDDLKDFLKLCLLKDPADRPTPAQLLSHAYVSRCDTAKTDLRAWAAAITM